MLFDLKKWHPSVQNFEKTAYNMCGRPFPGVEPQKKVFFCWEKVEQVAQKFFDQKSFTPPKICLLLHLCAKYNINSKPNLV